MLLHHGLPFGQPILSHFVEIDPLLPVCAACPECQFHRTPLSIYDTHQSFDIKKISGFCQDVSDTISVSLISLVYLVSLVHLVHLVSLVSLVVSLISGAYCLLPTAHCSRITAGG
jgi:hypothetical protein